MIETSHTMKPCLTMQPASTVLERARKISHSEYVRYLFVLTLLNCLELNTTYTVKLGGPYPYSKRFVKEN